MKKNLKMSAHRAIEVHNNDSIMGPDSKSVIFYSWNKDKH